MIDVAEHVYSDDPRSGHPDVRTQLRDVGYFFIGNGLISAAIQFAPAGDGSLYGLLLMDPQELNTKREALSFHAETGISRTMLSIIPEDSSTPLERNGLTVRWDRLDRLPSVRIMSRAGSLSVAEVFYCPDRTSAVLARDIRVLNRASAAAVFSVQTGLLLKSISRSVELAPGAEKQLHITYTLGKGRSEPDLRWAEAAPASQEGRLYWNGAADIHFSSEPFESLFQSAAAQLPSVISRAGRIDAGIWQYKREWVRDQSMMALALVMSGHHRPAGVILARLLRDFVSESGSTVDSSEARAQCDAELDQNGVLLHTLREYVLWTGDLRLVRDNWDKISSAAEFPLQPCFREPVSGLMFNERDFWERHSAHGIKPGIEIAYQVYVSVGLSAAAALARQVGRAADANRWQAESDRLKWATMTHPTHALLTEKGFIKRRGIDGMIQEHIEPEPRACLPDGVGLARRIPHPLNPDSSCALPIVLGFVTPDSAAARATLVQMETLWNQAWQTGGYGRYHMDSDPDSPGPWPFPSIFIARACMECRQYDKVWRVLRWLASLPQYPSGSFFEMYGSRIAPPYAQNGIVPWNWAEMIMLVVQNILGFRPEENAIWVRPRLLPGLTAVKGSVPLRDRRLWFEFSTDGQFYRPSFKINSRSVAAEGEGVKIPLAGTDLHIEGRLPRCGIVAPEG